MPMRVIQVPPFVQLMKGPAGEQVPDAKPVSLRQMAHDLWFPDNRWQIPRTRLVDFVRVVEAFDANANKPGIEFQIREEGWEILCDIINRPDTYPNGKPMLAVPMYTVQLKSLEDCVLNAPRAE